MDQKWMFTNMLTPEYENGVEEFIKFAVERADILNHIKCSCIRCGYLDKVTVEV